MPLENQQNYWVLTLIDAVRSDNVGALRSIIRRARRDHWHRKSRIIGFVLDRAPEKGIRLLIHASMKHSQIMTSQKNSFQTALNYLQKSEGPYKAIEFYENFWHCIDSPIKQFMTCAYLCRPKETEIVVVTAHGTKLIYSAEKNVVCHGDGFSSAIDSYVKVEIIGSSAALFINANGTRFYLTIDKHGSIFIASEECSFSTQFLFEIRSARGIWFTLNGLGRFLSAEPSGKIVSNRDVVDDWELLRFGIAIGKLY